MLLDFGELYSKYNLNISGVIHIGAHTGEEYVEYLRFRVPKVIFFEPIPKCYNALCNFIAHLNASNPQLVCEATTCNYALGNSNTTVDLNISHHRTVDCAYGASSSILKPKEHLTQHPDVLFEDSIEVDMHRLDDLNGSVQTCNFINIDVQGYELEVFKGGVNTLEHIDYVMTEVNSDEVYENCARIEEVDKFLGDFGFRRVETCMGGGMWGDAFYIKETPL